MSEKFKLTRKETDGFPIFSVNGYFNQICGLALEEKVDTELEASRVFLILDLTSCTVLNSPGIGMLMEILFKVTDDYQGKIILFGADEIMVQTMALTGLLGNLELAVNLPDALEKAKAAQSQDNPDLPAQKL